MKQIIFTLSISLSTLHAQVEVKPRATPSPPPTPQLKSLATARLLSAVIPGAGRIYAHNYWRGALTFGIDVGLAGASILSWNAREGAPEEAEKEMTKGDYTILAILCGIGWLGYHIYQIWAVNDDVIVYNYKKRFLESSSLKLNFDSNKFTLLLAKNF